MTDIEIPLGKRKGLYRFLEMLPALTSYSLLLLPIVLSLISPFLASVFIIGYIILWFVKAMVMVRHTIYGYRAMHLVQKVNWTQRLADLENPSAALLRQQGKIKQWHESAHIKNLHSITSQPNAYYRPSEIYNAIIMPMYKETREVVEPSIQAILDSNYDNKRVIFILAYEQRAGKDTEMLAKDLADKYRSNFHHSVAINHPQGIPGELVGKGGNITNAGKYLQDFLARKRIEPDKVIVTTPDADNRLSPSYLANVTYEYIIDLKHRHRSYQPIALYLNNIWDVPAPMRVMATGNSFWTIIASQRPHMLRNFSCHSQGMGSLIDTNFWSVRTIVEDGHQYWRSFFRFDGDYEVTPIYSPVYQDAVLSSTYWSTLKAQFVQLRRWAYGASDVAYVGTRGFRKKSKVPTFLFIGRFLMLLDSHVSWAVAPLIITFGAWFPLFINHQAYRSSIIVHELPSIASTLQQIAMVGLFVMMFLSFKMLPPRPARYKRRRTIFMLLQWVFMPFTSVIYGSSAALYSQTRLLLGKYLDKFDVTVKYVKQ